MALYLYNFYIAFACDRYIFGKLQIYGSLEVKVLALSLRHLFEFSGDEIFLAFRIVDDNFLFSLRTFLGDNVHLFRINAYR